MRQEQGKNFPLTSFLPLSRPLPGLILFTDTPAASLLSRRFLLCALALSCSYPFLELVAHHEDMLQRYFLLVRMPYNL